jgi:hypothetical protein
MPSGDLLWVCAAAWFGSLTGTVYWLKSIGRALIRNLDKDPEIEKIDVTVVMRDA